MIKLNAKGLRTSPHPSPTQLKKLPKNPIWIVLDNVMDTYNVGALFRLADAVAAENIILCGETETPPNPRIKKASVNTWQWVNWEYRESAAKAIKELKIHPPSGGSEFRIVVVEQHRKSIPLAAFQPSFPVVVVVGHETEGVSKEVLDLADTIVELPMFGVNQSLNVMVCCGIVLYKLVEFLPHRF